MALIEEVRVMSFSRLLFVAFLMITSLMAQTTPPSGYAYFCSSPAQYQNPFHPVLFVYGPTTRHQFQVDFTKLTPPPEFQLHSLRHSGDTKFILQPSVVLPAGCQLVHINAKGQIH
jgi:hypothetical protein